MLFWGPPIFTHRMPWTPTDESLDLSFTSQGCIARVIGEPSATTENGHEATPRKSHLSELEQDCTCLICSIFLLVTTNLMISIQSYQVIPACLAEELFGTTPKVSPKVGGAKLTTPVGSVQSSSALASKKLVAWLAGWSFFFDKRKGS